MPAPKPSTVSSEMKNKVWNVSLKTFVLKGLLKKFKGRACVGGWAVRCQWQWYGSGDLGPKDVPFQKLCEKTRAGVCGGYFIQAPLGHKVPLGADRIEGHWGQKEG